MALVGLVQLLSGIDWFQLPLIPFVISVPLPVLDSPPGTMWLAGGFLVLNLLILLEVADRLTLKKDLEVAREIQQAMLPSEIYTATGIEAFGVTRPANTVGGDLYDVIRRPDGRIVFALGDVAGKGSPAALLMALAVAMLRVLVDEGLEPADLAARLNIQVSRHAPGSRFITMVLGLYDPATGAIAYVNAGQNPPLLRRASGDLERLTEGGVALGMFDQATYTAGHAHPRRRRRAGAVQRRHHRGRKHVGRRVRRRGPRADRQRALVEGSADAGHLGAEGRRDACRRHEDRRRSDGAGREAANAAAARRRSRTMTAMRRARVALLSLLALASASPTPAQPEGIDVLLERVEASLTGGDKQAFAALTRIPAGDETFRVFLDRWFVPATTRATVHERDRVERDGPNALRLIVEVLVETGPSGAAGHVAARSRTRRDRLAHRRRRPR